ncbi:MAG: DUF2007 domain-containing protein [Planctomycetes bacterium]|nr:DUF2007 domain-containing protein [Planctomycetota bacterium]
MTPSEPEEDLVLAFHADSPSEAELIRALLEDQGIFAMVADRNSALPGLDLNPFDPDSGNVGCDVFVRSEDRTVAVAAIRASREAAGDYDDPGDEPDDSEEEEYDESDAYGDFEEEEEPEEDEEGEEEKHGGYEEEEDLGTEEDPDEDDESYDDVP